jgi:hypothetical protein
MVLGKEQREEREQVRNRGNRWVTEERERE